MKKELSFIFVRAAKEGGGDRYEYGVKKTPDYMVIYFPQSISRPTGLPIPLIKVTIEA